MGFFGQGVWIIGYRGLMGYGMGIPAYQSRRITPLWGFGGYGLFTLWVMRGSTVAPLKTPLYDYVRSSPHHRIQ